MFILRDILKKVVVVEFKKISQGNFTCVLSHNLDDFTLITHPSERVISVVIWERHCYSSTGPSQIFYLSEYPHLVCSERGGSLHCTSVLLLLRCQDRHLSCLYLTQLPHSYPVQLSHAVISCSHCYLTQLSHFVWKRPGDSGICFII